MRWIEKPKSNWLRKRTKPKPQKVEAKPDKEGFVGCIAYVTLHCPECDTTKTQCYGADLPIRYHKCENGHKFKSVEK